MRVFFATSSRLSLPSRLSYVLCAGLNNATEVFVKTTLADKIMWYKVFADEEELTNKARTPLSCQSLASRTRKKFVAVSYGFYRRYVLLFGKISLCSNV